MVYRKKGDQDGGEGEGIRGFKVVHFFDVSPTEDDDLPEFAKITGDAGSMIEAVESLVRQHGIDPAFLARWLTCA